MTLHLRVPKYHCRQCNWYFRHNFIGIRPRYRASEACRLEAFEAHDGGVTLRKVSLTHQVSPATVERWYQAQLKAKKSEISNRPFPRVLGIYEHFFTRKKGYATIVADRFHVVRLINQRFLKVWQQHNPEGKKNRGLISLMRRHQWYLKPEQSDRLDDYLSAYPVLKQLYTAKQEFIRFMLLKTLSRPNIRNKLPRYFELLEQLRNNPLRALAKTLTQWMEPIVAMWRFSRSNGITEGLHTKMEMISRRAYGFRNFGNYRLRVLTHCGWDGIVNRVR